MSRSSVSRLSCSRLCGGHSASSIPSTSIATTSAPRRSISNAQNPSKVPMSSTRLPLRSSGSRRSATGRMSTKPGVTTPGASSMVWYQTGFAAMASRADSMRSYGPRMSGSLDIASDDRTVEILVTLDHELPVVLGRTRPTGLRGALLAPEVQRLLHRSQKIGLVPGRVQAPHPLVGDDLRAAAGARGDDRGSGGHRLDQDESERLARRGQDGGPRLGVGPRQLGRLVRVDPFGALRRAHLGPAHDRIRRTDEHKPRVAPAPPQGLEPREEELGALAWIAQARGADEGGARGAGLLRREVGAHDAAGQHDWLHEQVAAKHGGRGLA